MEPKLGLIGFTRILVVACACTFLSACSTMWPTMKKDSEISNGSCSISKLDPDGNAALAQAHNCLEGAKAEFNDKLEDAGLYDKTIGYVAVAGGSAAGYNLAENPVHLSPLKNIGIGLAGLAGFDVVVGSQSQRDVLIAGSNALICVENAALAAHLSQRLLPASGTQVQWMDTNEIGGGSFSTYQAELQERFSPKRAEGKAVVESLAARVGASANSLTKAHRAFVNDIDTAANPTVLAQNIIKSVNQIRSVVRGQLTNKKSDPIKIYKDQQALVAKMIGDAAKSAEQKTNAVGEFNTTAQTVGAKTENDNTTAAAKVIKDAYQECVAAIPGVVK